VTSPPPTGRLTGLAFTIGATLALAGVAPAFGQNLAETSVRVDSIVVSGNFRHSETDIIDRSGLRVGNIVQLPQVQDAIRGLFATGNYADIQVAVSGDDRERGIFYITVEERPYITRYEFEGLESLSAGTVRDTIGLAQSAPLDPDRITRAQAFILEALSNEGFPTAQVDTVIRPDPSRPGDSRLAFRVREGPRLGVTSIRFEGNDVFTDGQLRSAMITDQEGFLWFNQGQLKKDEYRLDLAQRLPEYYARHGYLDFQVVDDTVISDPVTGKGRIVIWVEEGPQYTLEELRVVGNRAFAASVIEESARAGQLEVDEGEVAPFNQPAFFTASGGLGDLYRNSGYLNARILPDVQRLPPSEPGGSPRVAAVLNIREGEPSYFREINIEGNTYTHDRIVRNRLFILPGDIYSQERLVSSVQAIQGLGFFEPLPPDQAIEFAERPDGDIDITMRVQEKQTGTVNFGVTASGISGFAGFIGYEQPNLFGQAKVGRFRWIFGRRQQDIDVSYSDPEIFGSRQSATLTLRSSRDRFTGFSLGDRRQTGGLVEVGTPVFGLRSVRLFVGYSLFNDRVSGLDTTNISEARRQLLTSGTRSGLSFRLVQDNRNNPLFPTAGSRNTISLRHTGGFLGGSGNYQKVDLGSEWFVPVAQIGGGLQSAPMEFTFGMNFAAGVILGDNPFFTERYFVGGTQAGIQLRGYEEATVTPLGHIPREARLSDLDRVGESYFKAGTKFGLKLTSSIFVSAFMDAGNSWRTAGELNPTDLLVGAGLGVSLVSPFGPIGLDYAYGFDRRDVLGRPDPGWQLHFKFGQIF
jgi:outer membrane protein insertion porin family